MKVAFEAVVKDHRIKSLVSLDKGALLILGYNADNDELVDNINKLHKPDATVYVVIMDRAEWDKEK